MTTGCCEKNSNPKNFKSWLCPGIYIQKDDHSKLNYYWIIELCLKPLVGICSLRFNKFLPRLLQFQLVSQSRPGYKSLNISEWQDKKPSGSFLYADLQSFHNIKYLIKIVYFSCAVFKNLTTTYAYRSSSHFLALPCQHTYLEYLYLSKWWRPAIASICCCAPFALQLPARESLGIMAWIFKIILFNCQIDY